MWSWGNRVSCQHGKNIKNNGIQAPPYAYALLVDGDTHQHTNWWSDPPW